MPGHRWSGEGEDAAALAKAILSGTVTSDLQTFKDFFGENGLGAEIGHKFDFHTPKGRRNLQINWKNLIHKINIWKTNKEDPKTGKRKSRHLWTILIIID